MKRLLLLSGVLVSCAPAQRTEAPTARSTAAASWSSAAPMAVARTHLTLTLLPSGKVLAIGGSNGSLALSSAELYDPTTNSWSSAGSMSTARSEHTATLLGDGRVVVLGGSTSPTIDVYNAGSWSTVGSLLTPRTGHTATLVGGKILAVGGDGGIGGTSELFDPSTGASVSAGTTVPRSDAAAALLASGKVLVIGGVGATVAGASLFDPTTKLWSSTGSMVYPRYGHTAVLFASGKVLVDGGRGASETATIAPEIYDPTSNAWTALPTRGAERRDAAAVLLASEKALLVGGNALPTAPSSELFDPASSTWVASGALVTQRSSHAAIRLSDGRVLVAGGTGTSGVLSSAEIFALQLAGATCTLGGECASSFCVDGVCCDTACTGQCEACDGPVKGTCSAVAGAPHGSRTACSAGAGDVCKAQVCNGTDRMMCHYPSAGTPACSSAACADGIETHPSTCNGAGACSDVATSCGAYACGGAACKKTCTASTDCAAGARCVGSECVTLPGLGETCSGSSSCTAGLYCVDGVCCGVPACAAGSSCAAGPTKGLCAKLPGSECTNAAQCGSGFCVDGVCCDSACEGQCEACDTPDATGRKGKCLPVKGAPHTTRLACSVDPTNACGATTCDGATRTSCAGLVAEELSCRAQSCKDGVLTLAASCDGKGACPAAQSSPCSGFGCDDAGRSCKTTCATVADCVDGFDCLDKICKRRTTTCSPDGRQRVDPSGAATDCAPYVCVAGECRVECATSIDCQGGTVCQEKKCVAPTVDEGGATGGCTATKAPTNSLGWALLAIGTIAARRRRR